MVISEKVRKHIENLVCDGARLAAEKLSRISNRTWTVAMTVLSPGKTIPPEYLLDADHDHHFETFFTIPGGAFLVVYHRKAGIMVTHTLTKNAPAEVEILYKLEAQALSEASKYADKHVS